MFRMFSLAFINYIQLFVSRKKTTKPISFCLCFRAKRFSPLAEIFNSFRVPQWCNTIPCMAIRYMFCFFTEENKQKIDFSVIGSKSIINERISLFQN